MRIASLPLPDSLGSIAARIGGASADSPLGKFAGSVRARFGKSPSELHLVAALAYAAADERYWPAARERFALGAAPEGSLDELLVSLIHDRTHADGSGAESELDERYPSHLHIDLLPEAQGQGFGRRLIERLIGQLDERGSSGVHLGVSKANHRAIAFYRHVGFVEWDGPDDGINLTFVRTIS